MFITTTIYFLLLALGLFFIEKSVAKWELKALSKYEKKDVLKDIKLTQSYLKNISKTFIAS